MWHERVHCCGNQYRLIGYLLLALPLVGIADVVKKPSYKAQYSENGIINRPEIPTNADSPKTEISNKSSGSKERYKVYRFKQSNGVIAFSDYAPTDKNYQILHFDCYACQPNSEIDWVKLPLFTDSYSDFIAAAAVQYSLDPALIRAVIHAESGFKLYAISKSGAMGLMQLMPATAKELGVTNAFEAKQNIDAGSRYLAKMLKRFNGDIELACAAYNAGPTTVANYKGIPPYPETQAYVKRVKILLNRYQAKG